MSPAEAPRSFALSAAASGSSESLSLLAIDLYENSVPAVVARSEDLLRQARRASRCLVSVSILQGIGLCACLYTAKTIGKELPFIWLNVISTSCLFLLSLFLAIWSRQSPLAPAIAGLAIFLTTWWGNWAYTFASAKRLFGKAAALAQEAPSAGALVKLAVLISLVRAIKAGAKHRRMKLKLATPTQVVDTNLPLKLPTLDERRFAGLASGISLYVTLLYLSINMIALWGDDELSPLLFKKLVGVMSIIVITWSIASWRDVYRPLIKPINPGWYFLAMLIGSLTFAVAHGWIMLIRHVADVPMPDTNVQAGLNEWHVQLLLIAVQPAIIEEIAFRGIIFAALMRSLGGWETVIVTALMFMVLHLAVPAFPHLLFSGLIFGALRLKSGSWLPGVFMHFVHNFLAIIFAAT